jgi:hypothetical protein
MPPRFGPAEPIVPLRTLADSLGWHRLEMWQHTLDDGQVVTWYSTTHPKFYLQINEHPVGDPQQFAAAVIAIRYGIHTGWHRFRLADPNAFTSLSPWLTRDQSKRRQWRAEFARTHPECCLERPTPLRVRRKYAAGEWPPYRPDDAKPPPC